MDEDGSNVTQIAPMNIGSALHPTPLVDGRLAVQQHGNAGAAGHTHVGHLVHLARRPQLVADCQRLPRRTGLPLHDPAVQRRPRRHRLLQPQRQRLRRAVSAAAAAAGGDARASSVPSRTTTRRFSKRSAAASSIRFRCRSHRGACTRSCRSRTARTKRRPSAPTACASASSRIRRPRRTTTCSSSGAPARPTTSTARHRCRTTTAAST